MKANSNQVNLRLSKQAVTALAVLAEATGSTKTAIVEQAIVRYAKQLLTPADFEALITRVAYDNPPR